MDQKTMLSKGRDINNRPIQDAKNKKVLKNGIANI